MLAAVLKGEEMNLITARVSEIAVQITGVTDQQKRTDKSMAAIQKSIDSLFPLRGIFSAG